MLLQAPSSWELGCRKGLASAAASRTQISSRQRRRPGPLPAAAAASAAAPSSLSTAELAERLVSNIVVTGGGPAGLATAVALQRVGLPAVVLEREPELNTAGTALGLWTNAWRALEALGTVEPLRKQHPEITRVELVRSSGRLLRSFGLAECEGGPHEFRGVLRSNLLAALAAQLQPGTLLTGCPVEGVESTENGAALRLGDGVAAAGAQVDCLAVVGADGSKSAAAAAVGRGPPRYVGQVAIRGVAPFPEGVPCSSIRQVWGEGVRAGMYPVSDTQLYWFVCFDSPGDASVPTSPEALRAEALSRVAGWAWGVPEAVKRTPDEALTRSRIVDRWDLPTASSSSHVTLAGDALHPMTPNLGQGGCTALEDAVVLARLLRDGGVPQLLSGSGGGSASSRAAALGAIGETFREYERQRAKRCLPLTVRSFAMGALLQLPLAPVVAVRDAFVSQRFSPAHFLDHAAFDCGTL